MMIYATMHVLDVTGIIKCPGELLTIPPTCEQTQRTGVIGPGLTQPRARIVLTPLAVPSFLEVSDPV